MGQQTGDRMLNGFCWAIDQVCQRHLLTHLLIYCPTWRKSFKIDLIAGCFRILMLKINKLMLKINNTNAENKKTNAE